MERSFRQTRGRMQSIFSDSESQNKVKSMIMYILQEGYEKANEIDVVTEFEFEAEKFKHIKENITLVENHYDKLIDRFSKSLDIEISVMKNGLHCNVLRAHNAKIEDMVEIARKQLTTNINDSSNASIYNNVLYLLLIQGLCKMLEPQVELTVRKQDVKTVKNILNKAKSYYESKTQKSVEITVNEDKFLAPIKIGGIYMTTRKQHIRLDNTLETRLTIIIEKLMPQIRNMVFGFNPNRKFFD